MCDITESAFCPSFNSLTLTGPLSLFLAIPLPLVPDSDQSLMVEEAALSQASQTLPSQSRMKRSWALMMRSRRTPMTTARVSLLSYGAFPLHSMDTTCFFWFSVGKKFGIISGTGYCCWSHLCRVSGELSR